jgi:YD repeat-containing protein
MKKLIYLLSISFLLLQSCSSSDSSGSSISQSVLIKKIVYDNGEVENYSYNGNKLLKISFEDGTSRVITYTGDLITKEEIRDESNTLTGEFSTMSYLNNRLMQVKFYYNNILFHKDDYNYNVDGTRTITETYYKIINFSDARTSVKKQYFDSAENVIKEEGLNANNTINSTKIYQYDTKNNPHLNITGWINVEGSGPDKINNLIKETSSTIYTYKYEYNDQGYPISRIMTTGNSTYSEQYFY